MTWSFQKSYSNKVCLTVSADLVSCNLTLSLFFTFPDRTKGRLRNIRDLLHISRSKSHGCGNYTKGLRSVCSDSSASGHLEQLLLARCAVAWCPLLFTDPLKKKADIPVGVFFFERSHPAEKVYNATLLCHPNGWDRSEQTPFFLPVKLLTSRFPVQHSDSRKPEVNNRFFLSPPFSCLVPTRWLPRPNSQPIPARLLPFEQLGRFVDQPSSFRAKPQSAGTPGLQSAHLELDVSL